MKKGCASVKILEITIGDVIVEAELFEDKAPLISNKIIESSPLEGRLNHAKVCDNEVFFMSNFYQDIMENVKLPESGDIGYWAVRQTICIWFDETIPLGPSIVFAKIFPEDLAKFSEEARKVWKNPGTPIRMVVK